MLDSNKTNQQTSIKRVTNPILNLCCPNRSRVEVWVSDAEFWMSKPLLANQSPPHPQTAAGS